jgi:hypothetical protein
MSTDFTVEVQVDNERLRATQILDSSSTVKKNISKKVEIYFGGMKNLL